MECELCGQRTCEVGCTHCANKGLPTDGQFCYDCQAATMPISQFRAIFLFGDWNRIQQRRGQFASNLLTQFRRDLSIKLPHHLDPFYDDKNLIDFWGWVEKNW